MVSAFNLTRSGADLRKLQVCTFLFTHPNQRAVKSALMHWVMLQSIMDQRPTPPLFGLRLSILLKTAYVWPDNRALQLPVLLVRHMHRRELCFKI